MSFALPGFLFHQAEALDRVQGTLLANPRGNRQRDALKAQFERRTFLSGSGIRLLSIGDNRPVRAALAPLTTSPV